MERNAANNGFTLLEVVVAMGIAAIVMTVLGTTINQLGKVNTFVSEELANRQGLEQVFEMMITEMRSMGPSSIGDYPVKSASSTEIIFYSDVDGDGVYERLRYYFTSSTLSRGLLKPTGNPLVYATSSETSRIMVTGLIAASSSFTYYDSNYSGTQLPLTYPIDVSVVRLVGVSVYADVQSSLAPQPTIFTDTIAIRNLRTN
jgi:prepilin-type N-terminal cleavage/methylation domain-containing protein